MGSMQLDTNGSGRGSQDSGDFAWFEVGDVPQDDTGPLLGRKTTKEVDRLEQTLINVDVMRITVQRDAGPAVLLEQTTSDPEGARPHPRFDVANGTSPPQSLRKGLRLRIARQLGIAGVPDEAPPQRRVHLPVRSLDPTPPHVHHVSGSPESRIVNSATTHPFGPRPVLSGSRDPYRTKPALRNQPAFPR
jgi:hypothetical protein